MRAPREIPTPSPTWVGFERPEDRAGVALDLAADVEDVESSKEVGVEIGIVEIMCDNVPVVGELLTVVEGTKVTVAVSCNPEPGVSEDRTEIVEECIVMADATAPINALSGFPVVVIVVAMRATDQKLFML